MKATIDIGTNTVLLLIAESGGDKTIKVIRDEARITRLGQKLHALHLFPPAAMKRTLTALKEFKTLCDQHFVSEIAAVGTAAFRKARNASEFVEEILRETGIKVEIISGEDEALYSYTSVLKDFGSQHQNLMALDIGGGSTEIISINGSVSLPLGCVELTERYLISDPVTPQEMKRVYEIIEKVLANPSLPPLTPREGTLLPPLGVRGGQGELALVGLAGTCTTLSAINQKLTVWNPAKIQGSILTLKELPEITQQLATSTIAERKQMTGMVPERADTLLSGAMILQKVMEKVGVEKLLVSDRGLRFGLFIKKFSSSFTS
ncbi:MAG: Ppx/GppA phosphatase family protein [Deltaproteobacteria bacterium]|nr:Ppx/GppA phosphatase family protein [Deltaproteobacteria bacterium]